MTTYQWAALGGTGAWNDASQWTPNTAYPGAGDTAQVGIAFAPITIDGTGTAAEFDTANQSGDVTLAGNFNIGTVYNGATLTLADTVIANYIETFISLDITGTVSAVGDLSNPYNGIIQYTGEMPSSTATIEAGATVTASEYVLANITLVSNGTTQVGSVGGTLDVEGQLRIPTLATVDASNQIDGGLDIDNASTVEVQNHGYVATTYLQLQDPSALLLIDNSLVGVTETSNTPNGIAGLNNLAGTVDVQNGGTLQTTYYYQGGDPDSALVVDGATLTVTLGNLPGTYINGIDQLDGTITFENSADVSATQVYLGAPTNPADDSYPTLLINESTLTITGTTAVPGFSFSGLWIADGQATVDTQSQVTTPGLEVDSPPPTAANIANDDPQTALYVMDDSDVDVGKNIVLGVSDSAEVSVFVGSFASSDTMGGTGGTGGDGGMGDSDHVGPGLGYSNLIGSWKGVGGGTGIPVNTAHVGIVRGNDVRTIRTADDTTGGGGDTTGGGGGDTFGGGGSDTTGSGGGDTSGGGGGTTGGGGPPIGGGARLRFGGNLLVGDDQHPIQAGATADLLIESDSSVIATASSDTSGIVFIGVGPEDQGYVEVGGDGALLQASRVAVGYGGQGELFVTAGGSVNIDGLIDLGVLNTGTGNLELAGQDGPGALSAYSLIVGDAGYGIVDLTSLNLMNAGDLSVTYGVIVGNRQGGNGEILGTGGSVIVGRDLVVGNAGTGLVELASTDLTVGGDLIIGGQGAGAGIVTLSDVSLDVSGNVAVGDSGSGALYWSSTGDQFTQLNTVGVGVSESSTGLFDLTAPTTTLTIGALFVGNAGFGQFLVDNGASLSVTGNAVIGALSASGGGGGMTVDVGHLPFTSLGGGGTPGTGGPGGAVFEQDLIVGEEGVGTLLVGSATDTNESGAVLVQGDLVLGDDPSGQGVVIVGGAYTANDITYNASLEVDGNLYVGNFATGDSSGGGGGVLSIGFDGTVEAISTADDEGNVIVAAATDSTGIVNVDDGGELDAGTLAVGQGGDGLLTIGDDDGGIGTVSVSNDMTIGDAAGSSGTVTVAGDGSQLMVGDNLIIGNDATPIIVDGTIDYPAILDAEDGAYVANFGTDGFGIFIGADQGALGEAVFDAATLDASLVVVGDDGSGVLELLDDSSGIFDDDLILGDGPTGFGGMVLDASTIEFSGAFDVGEAATGATIDGSFVPGGLLTIADESSVVDQGDDGIDVGVTAGSTGAVSIDDSDVDLSALTVGDAGSGTMTVTGSTDITVAPDEDIIIGDQAGASGTLVVDDSDFSLGADLFVGVTGTGTLYVQNNALVGPGSADDSSDDDQPAMPQDDDPGDAETAVTIGDDADSSGLIVVDSGTLWADDLTIGNSGTGTLVIQDGGTVGISGDATLAADSGGVGNLPVTGVGTAAPSILDIDGDLDDGYGVRRPRSSAMAARCWWAEPPISAARSTPSARPAAARCR
jgi:T5SS/PEP-CTERM-associated repeat protein